MSTSINDLNFGQVLELISLLQSNTKISNVFDKFVGKYCVVRSYADGVHLAVIDEITEGVSGFSATLSQGRRLHYWEGAFTLNAVADKGIDLKKSRLSDIKNGQYSVANVTGVFPVTESLVEIYKSSPSHKF